MNTALAKVGMSDAIERALIHGDLKDLNPEGRLQYYKAVCDSLGLNPLTRPFEYIVLNGKLTLYAKRDCAEQLRKIHGVRINTMVPQQIGDLFVVSVTASDAQGRTDSSTGAVNIKGLGGENLANAMMKAETKAKRRVTLSLCGLGLLDETEVASIPDAKPFEEVAPTTNLSEFPKPLLTRQLEASVEIETKKAEPDANYKFHTNGNLLVCRPVDVVEKKTKRGSDYLLVKFDGDVQGHQAGFCYHAGLFDPVKLSRGQVAQFEWRIDGNWLVLDNVLDIAGQEYRDGKPYPPLNGPNAQEEFEITDDDIPF